MQLGEILLDLGKLTQEDLDEALAKQQKQTEGQPKPTGLQALLNKAPILIPLLGILGVGGVSGLGAYFGIPNEAKIQEIVYETCGEGLEKRYEEDYGTKLMLCQSDNKDLEIELLTCQLAIAEEEDGDNE